MRRVGIVGGISVGVVNKTHGVGAKFRRGMPLCVLLGMARHFFSLGYTHNYPRLVPRELQLLCLENKVLPLPCRNPPR